MRPTVGRIVLYGVKPAGCELQPRPAIITRVLNEPHDQAEQRVHLVVFDHGSMFGEAAIKQRFIRHSEELAHGTWSWPPREDSKEGKPGE